MQLFLSALCLLVPFPLYMDFSSITNNFITDRKWMPLTMLGTECVCVYLAYKQSMHYS